MPLKGLYGGYTRIRQAACLKQGSPTSQTQSIEQCSATGVWAPHKRAQQSCATRLQFYKSGSGWEPYETVAIVYG